MRVDARPAAAGFLLLQLVIGYEWLSSGVTKLVHGDFPGGLATDLHDRARDSAAWYARFVDAVVIPHAPAFGYLIEISELAIGITLIASAVLLLVRPRLPRRALAVLAALTAAAAAGGLLLALNLTLVNGFGLGPVGPDSFDEGISLDVLLIGMQAILLWTSTRWLRSTRVRGQVRLAARGNLRQAA